jgi:hypothetical protein
VSSLVGRHCEHGRACSLQYVPPSKHGFLPRKVFVWFCPVKGRGSAPCCCENSIPSTVYCRAVFRPWDDREIVRIRGPRCFGIPRPATA